MTQSVAPVKTERTSERIFVYYDPKEENPPREGKMSINGVEFNPNSVTELTPKQMEKIQQSDYGKFLFELGSLKEIKDLKRIKKESISMLSLEEARNQVYSCVNIAQLRQWRKVEQRPDIRQAIQQRIRELNLE